MIFLPPFSRLDVLFTPHASNNDASPLNLTIPKRGCLKLHLRQPPHLKTKMFDFHLHTKISHDSREEPLAMVKRAEELGLSEICFTDHYDATPTPGETEYIFDIDGYLGAYSNLTSDKLKIRRGIEFGLVDYNVGEMKRIGEIIKPDFVIGSVHFADGLEMYQREFWQDRSIEDGFEVFLKQELKCVTLHDDFDVLGHINYVCKSPFNPTRKPLCYKDFPEHYDKIMKTLIEKGKGLEINTSGVDRVGIFLPDFDCIRRFRDLGGKIVTGYSSR